jgi:hypothetical protein
MWRPPLNLTGSIAAPLNVGLLNLCFASSGDTVAAAAVTVAVAIDLIFQPRAG